jgi:hypothetical protein
MKHDFSNMKHDFWKDELFSQLVASPDKTFIIAAGLVHGLGLRHGSAALKSH